MNVDFSRPVDTSARYGLFRRKWLSGSDEVGNLLHVQRCNVPPGQDQGVQDGPGIIPGEGGHDAVHDDAECHDGGKDD